MNGRMIRTYGSNRCENLTRLAVSAALLTLTACGGGGSSVDTASDLSNLQDIPPSIGAATDGSISAATDVAEIAAGQAITVGILNNDTIPPGSRFQLIGQPANGTARLLETGELEYVANADFEGTDSVEYALVAADGTLSRGMLYVAVACADCEVAPPAPAAALAATDEFGNSYCIGGNSEVDPDGDGYGWENEASCVIRPEGAVALNTLAANSDSVTLEAGTTTAVSALRNDSIADRASVNFAIDVQPTNGVIQAADAGVVVYTAPDNYEGTDSLVYSLTDTNGNKSMANIDFNIACATCSTKEGLRLSWPANPVNENIESYRVFFGPDENVFTSNQLSEIRVGDFGGSAPNAIYHLENDLNVSGNEGGCFRVTAVRGSEESEPSDPICFNLG